MSDNVALVLTEGEARTMLSALRNLRERAAYHQRRNQRLGWKPAPGKRNVNEELADRTLVVERKLREAMGISTEACGAPVGRHGEGRCARPIGHPGGHSLAREG